MLGNVLLIDDDIFCNKMSRFVLEQQKASEAIVTFETAIDALEHLKALIEESRHNDFPNVILLDLHMAHMNGWEFLSNYHLLPAEYRKKTRVYILTSSIMASDRHAASLNPDVCGYIEKPFTTAELAYIAEDMEVSSAAD